MVALEYKNLNGLKANRDLMGNIEAKKMELDGSIRQEWLSCQCTECGYKFIQDVLEEERE